MARHRSRNGKFTIPLALAAGLLPPAASIISKYPEGGWKLASQEAGRILTGWDWVEKRYSFSYLKYGALPIALGTLAHQIIGVRLGLNRALAAARIPLIRI